ncbi:MAG: alanine--tRNA ligase [Oscillospiraceae bacterium]|nr:alanine--tRNA ligase [Oscillospiraceae bacterium]
MEKMSLNQIRKEFLEFFKSKGHYIEKSFPLIPQNDKSLLLVNAGMQPLKPYFTGLKTPPSKRMATCQKCLRTIDIDNVGITSRHDTFFEMLGNFSFGDYFKREAIRWAWEFVTEVLKLPKEKLFATIYLDDDEAYELWKEETGIPESRIFRLGKEDNFWEIGLGPCGPCSEIHYDRGEGEIKNLEEFILASEADRIIEFWNLVFTQFDKDEEGNYNRLKNPNIDTGMGLERISMIMQGVNSIFEIDAFSNILNEVSKETGVKYGESYEKDVSLRIITDHLRSITFLISDNVIPSNEGRGYVLRRLLRRASRHGKKLGSNRLFLYRLFKVVVENFKESYPELKEREAYIERVILIEEEKFNETIDTGLSLLGDFLTEINEDEDKVIQGDLAFKLYDTFGFPVELTCEILNEKGLEVDMEGFNACMAKQKEMASSAREKTNYMGSDDTIVNKLPLDFKTDFLGYETTSTNSIVRFIIRENQFVNSAEINDEVIIVTDVTPFYGEKGGQVGDTGIIYNDDATLQVIDTKLNINSNTIHACKVLNGNINIGDEVTLKVDEDRRKSITRNHTAAHLLNQALRDVLGNHVHQAGSYIDDKKIRFDFTHFSGLSGEEIHRVEEIVNNEIMKSSEVETVEMPIEEAKESGAIALFDEKYGDVVRVVKGGDYSTEFCGGCHVKNFGEIGLFKITSEFGIASGIRRIEAVTGLNLMNHLNEDENVIKSIEELTKVGAHEMALRIKQLYESLKERDKTILELKAEIASMGMDNIINKKVEVKGVNLICDKVLNLETNQVIVLANKIKEKVNNSIVLLGAKDENKIFFICVADKIAIEKGAHCGKIIKEVAKISGGNGGGRVDYAQAGGKDVSKLDESISSARKIIENLLK